MQAAIEVICQESKGENVLFRFSSNHVISGRNSNTASGYEEFQLNFSLYADDGAFLYNTRHDLQAGTDLISLFSNVSVLNATLQVIL